MKMKIFKFLCKIGRAYKNLITKVSILPDHEKKIQQNK